jgi:hypothetical protein
VNAYRKGADKERQRVRWHLARGALWAARTAGSHSAFDVVAVYHGEVVLEQLKAGGKPTPADVRAFLRAVQSFPRRPSTHSSTSFPLRLRLVWFPDRDIPRVLKELSIPDA